MRREGRTKSKHSVLDARFAAGLCTLLACGCLPALKWWATAGLRRPAVAAIAVVAATIASAIYRFIVKGEFARCLAFSVASALAGVAVWGLIQLL